MIEDTLHIINKFGIHTRAAAKLVALASRFESKIDLSLNDHTANAKSIMGVITLGAHKDTQIKIVVSGADEEAALAAIRGLVEDKFGEKE